MIDTPIERIPMTAAMLVESIERFISDRASARDISDRWLASYFAEEPLRLARQVRNNKLEPETTEMVNAFRCGEINARMAEKQREIDTLSRELQHIARKTVA